MSNNNDKIYENWRKFLNEDTSIGTDFGRAIGKVYHDPTENSGDKVYFFFKERGLRNLEKTINGMLADFKKKFGFESSGLLSLKSIAKPVDEVQFDPSAETEMVDEGRKGVESMEDMEKKYGKLFNDEWDEDEKQERLRQRKDYYYNPDIDVGSKFPKVRKGVGGKKGEDGPKKQLQKDKKGYGELETPEEFQKYDLVIELEKGILEDIDTMIQEVKAIEGLFEQARDWYYNYHNSVKNVTASEREAALMMMLIAVYSPNTTLATNIAEAALSFKAAVRDERHSKEDLYKYVTMINKERGDAGSMRMGQFKVTNFSLNLLNPWLAGSRNEEGEVEYKDGFHWNVTVDTWIIDALWPILKRASTAKEFEKFKAYAMSDPIFYLYQASVVTQKAKEHNLLPHELQAIIWIAQKRRMEGEGFGTYEESAGSIKDSIKRIGEFAGIFQETMETLPEVSDLESVFNAYDEEGPFKAGSIVRGWTTNPESLDHGAQDPFYDKDNKGEKKSDDDDEDEEELTGPRIYDKEFSTAAGGDSDNAPKGTTSNRASGRDFKHFPSPPKKKTKKKTVKESADIPGDTAKTKNMSKAVDAFKTRSGDEPYTRDNSEGKQPKAWEHYEYSHLHTWYISNFVVNPPSTKAPKMATAIRVFLENPDLTTTQAAEMILGNIKTDTAVVKNILKEEIRRTLLSKGMDPEQLKEIKEQLLEGVKERLKRSK